MAKIDDLIERRLQQIPLTLVPRLRHRSPPTPNLGQKGITNRAKPESRIAGKPSRIPRFLAIPITSSLRKSQTNQPAGRSSQTTRQVHADGVIAGCPASAPAQVRRDAGSPSSSVRRAAVATASIRN